LAIPPLDDNGYLPPGVHLCSLTEIVARFVYNEHRRRIWDGFEEYAGLIKGFEEISAIYFDGSFIGDCETPSDLDLSIEFRTLYDWSRLGRANPEVFGFRLVKSRYCVDVLPVTAEIYSWQLPDGNVNKDPRIYFQNIRPEEIEKRQLPIGSQKGILSAPL
jgi:hypothetical protein